MVELFLVPCNFTKGERSSEISHQMHSLLKTNVFLLRSSTILNYCSIFAKSAYIRSELDSLKTVTVICIAFVH